MENPMQRKYRQSPGYGETIIDPETGERYRTDIETGEAVKLVTTEILEGSDVISPQEKRRREAYKECLKEEENKKFLRKHGSKYYFASSSGRYDDLFPATMARLIYLVTYMDYGGKLEKEPGIPMKKRDLQQIMGFSSESQVYYFWREVNPKYLFEDEKGNLVMNKSYFQRGKLKPGDAFQQFYIEAVRELYKRTDPRKHKHLGAVFQMLPFVSLEFNVLCHNPAVEDMGELDFLTLDEFCDAIDYSRNHRNRLPKLYKEITFPVGDNQEVFCSFVTDGGDIDTAKIFVNPRVLYKGSRPDEVRILGKFCEKKS